MARLLRALALVCCVAVVVAHRAPEETAKPDPPAPEETEAPAPSAPAATAAPVRTVTPMYTDMAPCQGVGCGGPPLPCTGSGCAAFAAQLATSVDPCVGNSCGAVLAPPPSLCLTPGGCGNTPAATVCPPSSLVRLVSHRPAGVAFCSLTLRRPSLCLIACRASVSCLFAHAFAGVL